MKKDYVFYAFMALFLIMGVCAGFTDQSHPANEVEPGSFAQGDFSFPEGSLNVSGVFFVDNDTESIGIGTNSPDHQLEVVGNMSAGSDMLFVDGTNRRVGVGYTNPYEFFDLFNSGGDTAVRIVEGGGLSEYKIGVNNGDTALRIVNSDGNADIGSSDKGIAIATDGDVGIGITTPGSKLDIKADSDGVDTLVVRPNSGDNFFTIKPEVIADRALFGYWTGSNWGELYVPATNTIFENSGSESMRIDSDGDVGIGITNPLYKVHVQDSATADDNRFLHYNKLIIDNTSISSDVYYRASSNLLFNNYNGSVLGDSDENHTYGYASYNYVLNSEGANDASLRVAAATYNLVENEGTGHDTIDQVYGSYNGVVNDNSGFIDLATSVYGYYNNDDGITTTARGVYAYVHQEGSGEINTAAGLRSHIKQTAGTINTAYGVYSTFTGTMGTKYGIYSSGEDKNYFSNKIGIGETNPDTLLHLTSSTENPTMRLEKSGATGDIAHDGSSMYVTNYASGDLGVSTGNDIAFLAGESERMRVDASGNVGIGTISPLKPLHVAGNSSNFADIMIENEDMTAGSRTRLVFAGRGTDNVMKGIARVDAGKEQEWTSTASTRDGYLAFATRLDDVNNEKMRITSSGNVGIGTVSPTEELHIHSDSDSDSVLLLTTNSTGTNQDGLYVGIVNADKSGWLWNYEDSYLGIGTNNTEVIRVTADEKVGIGTTAPESKLTVADDTTSPQLIITPLTNGNADPSIELHGEASFSTEGLGLRYDNDVGDAYLFTTYDSDAADIHFVTKGTPTAFGGTGSERLTILGNGNVGIGTTDPTSKLHLYESHDADEGKHLVFNHIDVEDETLTADRYYRAAYNTVYNNYDGDVSGGAEDHHPYAYASYNFVQNDRTNDAAKLRSAIGTYNYVLNQGGSSSHINAAYGTYNFVFNNFDGEMTTAIASYGYVRNDDGTMSDARGVHGYVQQYGTGTITNAYGVKSYVSRVSGTVTNAYAFRGDMSGTIGTKYGIYLAGEDKNYFSNSVGIGATNPGNYKLYVSGTVYTSGGCTGCSDQRWKKDVTPLTNSIDKINQFRGVSFKWKSEEYPDMFFHNDTEIGLIAQDVENVAPELVYEDNGYKFVRYDKITPLLIEAVKEQQEKIEGQQATIEGMQEEIDGLKAIVCLDHPEAELCASL